MIQINNRYLTQQLVALASSPRSTCRRPTAIAPSGSNPSGDPDSARTNPSANGCAPATCPVCGAATDVYESISFNGTESW